MECNIYQEKKVDFFEEEKIREIVKKTIDEIAESGMISIHVIGDEKMKELNQTYRGKDDTTDVLSFAAQEGKQLKAEVKDMGDIFISLPQIRRQAREYEVEVKEEFARMLVHGVLHLAGFDHQEEQEAKKMFSLQKQIIKKINYEH